MFKLVFIIFLSAALNHATASELFQCSSSESNFTYTFNITNGTLSLFTDSEFPTKSSKVTYSPGTGEDILYTINKNGEEFGLLNGEEGEVRARLSHKIFGDDFEDDGIMCEAVKAPVVEKISCEEKPYRVDITFATIGGKGTDEVRTALYTLYKNDEVVSPALNEFKTTFLGYEDSLMMAYLWTFETENSMVGVALPSSPVLEAGTYDSAKSDLFVEVGNETFSGSTVSCTVTVQ